MSRLTIGSLLLLALAACTPPSGPPSPLRSPVRSPAPAERIVSLDYCADQFVLALAGRSRILALSPDATTEFSYLRDAAVGIPQVRSAAEDVLVLEPDLIVRSYGGGANAPLFFERLGIPVVQLGHADDLAGIQRNLRTVSAAMGVAQRGEALIAQMDRRLAALEQVEPSAAVLYLTPAGISSGPATLVGRMIATAGLTNFMTSGGWQPVPLERLAYQRPQLVATAFFGARSPHADAWTPGRHPLLEQQLEGLPAVALDDAWTVCGGWFVLDAIEALAGWEQAS